MNLTAHARIAPALKAGAAALSLLALLAPVGLSRQARHGRVGEGRPVDKTHGIVGVGSFTANPYSPTFLTLGTEDSVDPSYLPQFAPGVFGSQTPFTLAGNVDGTDVADLDLDGDNDFLMAEGDSGEVYAFINDGAGHFSPHSVASNVSTTYTTHLRIADFNNDGIPDFVVGDYDNNLGTKAYLGLGNGNFSLVLGALDTSVFKNPFGLAVGDLDGDGTADVAIMDYNAREGDASSGDVYLYHGNGDGSFGTPFYIFDVVDQFGGSGPSGIAAVRLTPGAPLDLVVENGTSGNYYVYHNDGFGTFSAPAGPAFTAGPQSGIDAYDADGDGDDDLAITSENTGDVYYVQNVGGSFATPSVVGVNPGWGIGAPPAAGVVYDICLQDDARPRWVLLWSSSTGAFQFCTGKSSVTGVGKTSSASGSQTLSYSNLSATGGAIRSLTATRYTKTSAAKPSVATIKLANGVVYKISDSNLNNNSCTCGK